MDEAAFAYIDGGMASVRSAGNTEDEDIAGQQVVFGYLMTGGGLTHGVPGNLHTVFGEDPVHEARAVEARAGGGASSAVSDTDLFLCNVRDILS